MKLSEKIYQCRKKAGLSQEALAAQLGVSRQAVSKWELGTAEPEPAKLKLLADTFHVSVDWLLSPDEAEYTPPRQDSPAQPQHPLPLPPGPAPSAGPKTYIVQKGPVAKYVDCLTPHQRQSPSHLR